MPKRLCVRCRGLPFEANAVSIVDFFDGQVDEAAIHFLADRPGGTKPHAGECYVDCVDEVKMMSWVVVSHARWL